MERDLKELEKPKRALTAYNFFFKEQRLKILAGELDESSVEDGLIQGCHEKVSIGENNGSSKSADATENKVPEKVSFENLGKIVGRRWRRLQDKDRIEYEDDSATDRERYTKEKVAYIQQCKVMEKLQKKQLRNENKKKRQIETAQANRIEPSSVASKALFSNKKGTLRTTENCNERSSWLHSFTNHNENPSLYNRTSESGIQYSRQFPYYSHAPVTDHHPYMYDQTATERSIRLPCYQAPFNYGSRNNPYERWGDTSYNAADRHEDHTLLSSDIVRCI